MVTLGQCHHPPDLGRMDRTLMITLGWCHHPPNLGMLDRTLMVTQEHFPTILISLCRLL